MQKPNSEKLMSSRESWKFIEGYESLYMVSNRGRIKSCGRTILRKSKLGNKSPYYIPEKILSCGIDSDGYVIVSLYKDSSSLTQKVHRLVAVAFLGASKEKSQVNHKDFNRKNNNLENLEWTTPKENSKHSARNNPQAYINRNGAHFRIHEREEILKLHFVYGLCFAEISRLYNRKPRTISRVCTNQVHNHNHLTI
jgi:hypothetical protein